MLCKFSEKKKYLREKEKKDKEGIYKNIYINI